MRLYDSSGTVVDSYTTSVANQQAGHYFSNVFDGASNGMYTLRISSSQNMTAAAWHSSGGGHTGVTAQRVEDSDGVWAYLPFYWSDYFSWEDQWNFTPIASGTYLNYYLYKRTDGSTWGDSTVGWRSMYGFADLTFVSANNQELYTKVIGLSGSGPKPLTVGRFENYSTTDDRIASYNGITKKSGTWYVPFAPSPVVQFAWSAYDSSSPYPTGIYGVGGTQYKPSWAQTLNYIDWTHDVNNGNNANYNGKSVYVPMDWGIGSLDCTKDSNDNCVSYPYNNSVRLGAIRNKVPSALAGRPLTLANEPNGVGQANMTLVEQARQVFVYRQWPGHLYSQAFANPFDGEPNQYDRGYTVAQGKTNPAQTDFPTFLEYYNSSEVPGNVPFDGMTVHVYTWKTTLTILYNRLLDWKTAADDNGWDVLIDEYGIIPIRASTELFCAKKDRISGGGCKNWQSPEPGVAVNECVESCQAGLVDDLRGPIRSAFGSALTSLMTFGTWMPDPCDACGDDRNLRWSIRNHFTTSSTTTSLGDAWITDSVNNP